MIHKAVLVVALVMIAEPAVKAVYAAAIPPPTPQKSDALVGVYYFPGWSQVDRWYCIAASETAQHPLLGYYREGDPDAADWHIKWALEHGVSFFSFDFYTSGGSQMLESALDGFLKSKFIDKFEFCLNWCNHVPASAMTEDEMDRFGDLVIRKYLTHPSYLRIENKPVVMILSGYGFIRNLGPDKARETLKRFEEKCKEAGLPGVYWVFCEGEIGSENDYRTALNVGVDAFTRYNYPYAGTEFTGPGKHGEATYTHLTEQGVGMWDHLRKVTGGKAWPTVMAGWDRRPWTKDQDLVRTGMTPELFADALRKSKEYLGDDPVVMIEAWNEWGEGSVLEPSVEHGFAYLDQVRDVFCPGAAPHKDVDPKSLGLRRPDFDLKLPSIDTWRFDFDAMGWTAKGTTGVQNVWGSLVTTSTNSDPQFTSPTTYLDCKNYPKAHIRMRATGPNGALQKATGQLFWSTVDSALSEDTSVKFEVPLDGNWHDYDLDLKSVPTWRGRTDRVRLDPVDAAKVKVEIDEIRFVRE